MCLEGKGGGAAHGGGGAGEIWSECICELPRSSQFAIRSGLNAYVSFHDPRNSPVLPHTDDHTAQ